MSVVNDAAERIVKLSSNFVTAQETKTRVKTVYKLSRSIGIKYQTSEF